MIYNDGYLPILGDEASRTRSAARSAKSGRKLQDQLWARCIRRSWPASAAHFSPRTCCCASGAAASELEDAFFTVSYSPVPDDTAPSGVGGVLVTAVETTTRVWVERALRELNETLEQQVAERTRERDRLWRVSDDLIGVAKFDGYWAAINPAATAILGWSEDELLSMPIAALWHPDDVATTLAHRRQLVEGGRPSLPEPLSPQGRLLPLALMVLDRRGRLYLRARPRRDRRTEGGGSVAPHRGAAAPGPEDGSGRPAHRRDRARLQQPADRRYRLARSDAEAHRARALRRRRALRDAGRRRRPIAPPR